MRRVLVTVAVLVALLGAACGGDDDNEDESASAGDETTSTTEHIGAADTEEGQFCTALTELREFLRDWDGTVTEESTAEVHDLIAYAREVSPEDLGDLDQYWIDTEAFFTDPDGVGNDLTADQQAAYEGANDVIDEYAQNTCGLEVES